MPDVAQLGIQVTADDRASKTLDDVYSRLRLTESAVDGLSATTVVKGGLIVGALLAVGTAAVKMGEQGLRAAADLEHSVANISTIKPDIDTSAVFKNLNNLQTQVPQTAKQLGDSLYDVFSSIDNVTEEQGLKLVETFAKGAVAAQTDAKTFGTAISGVLNAYKLDTSEATKVSDIFFNTVNRGVVTGPQLAAGLGPAIAAAKALGVSYEEAFALIVGATKEGGDAAQNINNITNLFSKLPTKEATADLNALGIATQEVSGKLRTPTAVLTDLKAKLDGMTEAARATTLLTIFPDLQARQGAQVIMSQLTTVNAALAENRTATNSTADAYAKMSATAIEQGKLLQNTWTALLTDMSVVALPALVGALGVVGGAVRGLREDFQSIEPQLTATTAAIGTAVTDTTAYLDKERTYIDTQLVPAWQRYWLERSRQPVQTGEAPPTTTLSTKPFGEQSAAQMVLGNPGTLGGPGEFAGRAFSQYGEIAQAALGQAQGQINAVFQGIEAQNAQDAAVAAEHLATDYSTQLGRRKPMMHDAGVDLGDAVGAGVAEGLAAEEPVARSAALVARDLEEARKRQQIADLGGAVAIREHTEALHQDEIAQLGGAVAIRDHADALHRQEEAALGGAVAMRDHAEALNREHDAALGGAVAIRDHAEALEAERVANLGGYAAIADHDAALTRQKNAAQQARTVFVDLNEQMSIYAKSTVPEAVQQTLLFENANTGIAEAMHNLDLGTAAQVQALKNAGDVYEANKLALTALGATEEEATRVVYGHASAHDVLAASATRAAEALRNEQQAQVAEQEGLARPTTGSGPLSTSNVGGIAGALTQVADAATAATTALGTHGHAATTGATQITQLGTAAAHAGTSLASVGQGAGGASFSSFAVDSPNYFNDPITGPYLRAHPEAANYAQFAEVLQARMQARDAILANGGNWTEAQTAGSYAQQGAYRDALLAGAQRDAEQAIPGLERQKAAEIAAAEATQAHTAATGANTQAVTAHTDAAAASTAAYADFTAGTGLATHAVHELVGFGKAATEAAKAIVEAANMQWAAAKANSEALQQNTILIAGFRTAVGLTYGQIYGNTGTQGASGSAGGGTNQGVQNLAPGNYYGLPVVSPLTGGTLRGFANGGMVYEPSYIVPTRTMVPSAIMAEHGPEPVGGGGGVNVTVVVQAGIGASEEVSARPFWNKVSQDHLVPILRSLGR